MIETIVEITALLVILAVGAVAAIIAAVVAKVRGDRALPLVAETVLLAMLGAFVARTFIAVVLDIGGNSREVEILVGWAFFLWPGAIDTVAALFGAQLVTQSDRLLWIAVAVGGLAGLVDGLHRIRDWPWPSPLTFILDSSWALAGATNGVLLHLFNVFGRSHAADGRRDAHRYQRGFHLKSGYAFTQGAVMSTLPDVPGTPLYAHERTHTLQVRVFGPFFTLSYLLWMALLVVPAAIVAMLGKGRLVEVVEAWCYYDNPWEAWGYKVQEREGGAKRTAFGGYVWNDSVIIATAVVFVVIVVAVSIATIGLVFG